MKLVVRLYPSKGLDSLWRTLEKHVDSMEGDNYIALYASQLSGKNFISVVFEIKDLEDIEGFYSNTLIKIPHVRKTETLTLMRTQYYQVPPGTPSNLPRFLVHFTIEPKYYSQVYEKVATFKYPKGIVLTYLSYSFGGDDILVSLIAEKMEGIMDLVENKYMKFPGVIALHFTHVVRSMRLVSKERWKKYQSKYMREIDQEGKASGGHALDYDELTTLTGGFVHEVRK